MSDHYDSGDIWRIARTGTNNASPRASYLPKECWDSDERMSGLMSMFKKRDVNPIEYDAKMRFWSDLIISSSSALRNPIFTVKQLSARFRRRDRVPAGLETVLREMISRGSVVPAAEYVKSLGQQGWISWSVDVLLKRPLSWVWGGSSGADDFASIEFVIPSVVQVSRCASLLRF